ncbi:hypothetical protein [Brevundimonas sp.]|uniref:hypothetical protein n=1 Tax=Brevundimonas sp. TaxID=1871086 RepID=UPI002AC97D74|nr:hypothetical protein [Brevundimonas sp.]
MHIGPDDEATRQRLKAALRKAGARRVGHWWGLGGSQEITRSTFVVDGSRLEVEAETYIGLSLSGEERALASVTRHL